ncbi:MAG: hypothetical protein U9P38_01770 [Campylobacterota bacterium]|nr:hypothetical protein [Campylobacterota bacterium]
MLDWDKIKNKTSELYGDATLKMRQYAPESFSKEKQFVNALVISLALMTMADKKAETDEVTAALDLINEIDEIKELDMTQDAIELYGIHIEELEKVIDNNVKWTVTTAKLLSELGRINSHPEYPAMIHNLLDYMAESDGNFDETEKAMKEKILAVLN